MTGMIKTIYVTKGFTRYVGGTIIEKTGADISTATFEVALGSTDVPPDDGWAEPDVSEAGENTAEHVVKKLIDGTAAEGTWFLWCRVTDNPEIEPVQVTGPFTIA